MTSTASSATSARSSGRRKKLRTVAKKSRTSCFGEGVVERQHRGAVHDLRETRRPAPRRPGRTGCRRVSAPGSAPRSPHCGGAIRRIRRPRFRARRACSRAGRDARSRRRVAPARPAPRPRSAPRPAARLPGYRSSERRSRLGPGDQARGGGARLGGDGAAGQHARDLLLPSCRRRVPRPGSR